MIDFLLSENFLVVAGIVCLTCMAFVSGALWIHLNNVHKRLAYFEEREKMIQGMVDKRFDDND
tara:strand:- start:140 stop:328 length:189 start_codon:yes stop_codon:yes gene_type:complete